MIGVVMGKRAEKPKKWPFPDHWGCYGELAKNAKKWPRNASSGGYQNGGSGASLRSQGNDRILDNLEAQNDCLLGSSRDGRNPGILGILWAGQAGK